LESDSVITRGWHDKKDLFAILFVLILLPIASQAGGLAIATITAIGAAITLVGLKPSVIKEIVSYAPKAIWAVFALLIWGLVSSLWSPYVSSRTIPNPVVLLLGVALFLLFSRAVRECSKLNAGFLQKVLIWTTVGSACAIFFDITSGYSISLAIDPVSAEESMLSKQGDLIQNLGHGVSVLTLLFPVVACLLWTRGPAGKLGSIALAVLIFVSSLFASVTASSVALICAILLMIYGARRPDFALKLTFAIAIVALLLAPVFAFLTTKLSPDQLSALPFSWEERIHNWRYIFARISEHPLIGHGFDAVRTFKDTHTIRGFDERAIVSLHPHNAGLHIWVELGFVGIALACTAILLADRQLAKTPSLSNWQKIALSGVIISAVANCSFTYGVWQDWWWASVIITCSFVALIRRDISTKN